MRWRAKSILQLAVAIARSCWCTGISEVSSISLDGHGTLSRQYGAQQLAGSAGIGQVLAGLLARCSRLFSSIWIGIMKRRTKNEPRLAVP